MKLNFEENRKVRMLNGYRTVFAPEHHRAMNGRGYNGFVYEHVLVAEKVIGRQLRKNEDVHHLDHNRQNNHYSNLLVLEDSQHQKLHGWIRAGMNIKSESKYISPYCKGCDELLRSSQKDFCSIKCSTAHLDRSLSTKVKDRPSKEALIHMIDTMSWKAIGRKYNVSDNSVRKWARKYGII